MTSATALAAAIAESLEGLAGVRVWTFASDTALPPAVVVERPTITWASTERTFSNAHWEWPLTVVVGRAHDKSAHEELDRIVTLVAAALGGDPTLGGVAQFSELQAAEPVVVVTGGQELPAYQLTLSMIA